MKKIFKTTVKDIEILEVMVEYLDDLELEMLVEKNMVLRYKCNIINFKKYKFQRLVVLENIKELCENDISLREKILLFWGKKTINAKKAIDGEKEIEVLVRKIKDKYSAPETFDYCTLFWQHYEEKLNVVGDELYEIFKKKIGEEKDINLKDIKEENKMDKDIMAISLGEFIQGISRSKDEQKESIEELKNKLNTIVENRELKKEINAITKKITSLEGIIKEENNELKKEINRVLKENESLKADVNELNKIIKQFNIEKLIKSLIESQTQINNGLKGSIIDNIQKNNERYLKEMESRLADKINKIETAREVNIEVSKPGRVIEPKIQPEKDEKLEGKGFEELLGALIL